MGKSGEREGGVKWVKAGTGGELRREKGEGVGRRWREIRR